MIREDLNWLVAEAEVSDNSTKDYNNCEYRSVLPIVNFLFIARYWWRWRWFGKDYTFFDL